MQWNQTLTANLKHHTSANTIQPVSMQVTYRKLNKFQLTHTGRSGDNGIPDVKPGGMTWLPVPDSPPALITCNRLVFFGVLPTFIISHITKLTTYTFYNNYPTSRYPMTLLLQCVPLIQEKEMQWRKRSGGKAHFVKGNQCRVWDQMPFLSPTSAKDIHWNSSFLQPSTASWQKGRCSLLHLISDVSTYTFHTDIKTTVRWLCQWDPQPRLVMCIVQLI